MMTHRAMGRTIWMLLGLSACVLAPSAVQAHRPTDPPHQLYQMGDLTLESGQVIRDFAISYVTHGTLNAKKSNAILMVTALSGNHHRLDFLIGPEAARYIRDVRTLTINPSSVTGHAAAGGFLPADVDFMNVEIGHFLDLVTQRGEKLR